MRFDVDPTSVSIPKSLIILSIPMMLEMAAQNLFNLVDTYFVSRIDYAAIGALVTAGIIGVIFFSLAVGVATASGIFVASHWGAKRRELAISYYSNAIALAFGVGLLAMFVVWMFLSRILHLAGLKGVTFEYARQYLSVSLFAFVPNYIFYVNNTTIRSIAVPTIALKVMVVVNLLNAVLDPVFMFLLGFGIRGAAFATIFSLLIGIAAQTVLFRRHSFVFSPVLIELEKAKELVRKGFFAFLHLFFRVSSMLVIIRIIGEISQAAVSAYGVVIRIYQVLLFIVFGMANAAFVVVGQNLGAGLFNRVRKAAFLSLLYAVAFVGTLDFALFVFRDPIVGFFVENAHVRDIALNVIFFYALSYPFVVASVISSKVSMALKDTERPSIANLVNLWFFNVPLAYYLSLKMGDTGVWLAIALANFTAFVLNFLIMRSNLRRLRI